MGHQFVLVHGGLHGAWCWWKLMDRLQKAGQKVTAVDLAGAGHHPGDPDTIFTFEEYNKPVVDLFETIPEGEKVSYCLTESVSSLPYIQLQC